MGRTKTLLIDEEGVFDAFVCQFVSFVVCLFLSSVLVFGLLKFLFLYSFFPHASKNSSCKI